MFRSETQREQGYCRNITYKVIDVILTFKKKSSSEMTPKTPQLYETHNKTCALANQHWTDWGKIRADKLLAAV